MKRLGVDVGGTFTDFFFVDDETNAIYLNKVPSTNHDPSIGVLQGALEVCEQARIVPQEVDQFFHGTTVATNIIIEHKGSKTGMLTTKGYRDVIYIARHKRPYNFSLRQDLPYQKYSLVERSLRLPVTERIIAPNGDVWVPLNEDDVREAVRKLKAEKVEAIAVCFLFSFLNPQHELRVKQIVQEEYPEAFLSTSHEVIPQFREYYRFTTTCLNSYIGPKVSTYVNNLGNGLKENGFKSELHLMQSSGGVATLEGAMNRPVTLLMSGPIAGLIGGIWAGRLAGFDSVITLDVGGTSADIGVAPNGEMRTKHLLDTKIGDYDAMVPMVDVDTIGAGGGSIAYVDEGGMFRVGPRSAGSEPGPVCYGRGGTEPTATDANLVLGRLNPDKFLGGKMQLSQEAAKGALAEKLCTQLDMTPEQAALGTIKILNSAMVNSIEMNSVRKGYDPRDFALVAFGGAGPLHACQVAKELNIPNVVIPPHPGITSAIGLLATDISYDYSKTELQFVSSPNLEKLNADFRELESLALERLKQDNVPEKQMVLQRFADCRYYGQGYELRVSVSSGEVVEDGIKQIKQAFNESHLQTYHTQFEDSEVQIVNIRVIGIGMMPRLEWQRIERGSALPDASVARRRVIFDVEDKVEALDTAIYSREDLKAGNRIAGPAVVEQTDTTTLIPPGLVGTVDNYGNIIIKISQ